MDARRDPPGDDPDHAETTPDDGGTSPDYPAVLDRVPAIIYVADSGDTGRWHYVSPQIKTILGYSPAEWCADPSLWLKRMHPEDRQRVLSQRDEVA